MKTIYALAVAAAVANSGTAAFASETHGSFFLENTNRRVTIVQLWGAPAGTDDPWQAVPLNNSIRPGNYAEIAYRGDNCSYDLKIRFRDGYEQQFTRVNVCDGSFVKGN
jgi:hypothetical protein